MRHFLANPWPRRAGRAFALAACACILSAALGGCAAPADEGAEKAPIVEGVRADSLIEGAAEGQSASSSTDPATGQAPQAARADARVDVYNGWFTEGMAARGAEELRAAGFNVFAVKNAGTPGSEQSHVAYRDPSFETVAQEAAQQLGIGIVFLAEPGEGKGWAYDGDVAVVLGGDWAEA